MAPVDIETLASILVKIGNLMVEEKKILEIDVNPLFVYEKGSIAVDARIIIS